MVPTPRAAHCSVVVGTKIFIIGGRSDKGPEKDVCILETDTSIMITKEAVESGASFFTNGNSSLSP